MVTQKLRNLSNKTNVLVSGEAANWFPSEVDPGEFCGWRSAPLKINGIDSRAQLLYVMKMTFTREAFMCVEKGSEQLENKQKIVESTMALPSTNGEQEVKNESDRKLYC